VVAAISTLAPRSTTGLQRELVRWHEVEGLITVEDVRGDALGELREFRDRLTDGAQRS
jgi:hypothetical protein